MERANGSEWFVCGYFPLFALTDQSAKLRAGFPARVFPQWCELEMIGVAIPFRVEPEKDVMAIIRSMLQGAVAR
jgi:hypothetical protein